VLDAGFESQRRHIDRGAQRTAGRRNTNEFPVPVTSHLSVDFSVFPKTVVISGARRGNAFALVAAAIEAAIEIEEVMSLWPSATTYLISKRRVLDEIRRDHHQMDHGPSGLRRVCLTIVTSPGRLRGAC
jgi:hypothetical protein